MRRICFRPAHQLALEAGDLIHGLLQQLLLIAGLFEKSSCEKARVFACEQGAGLFFDLELLLGGEFHRHPLTEVHCAIVAGYRFRIPMECPRCSSGEIRAIATNGKESDRVTRQRRCVNCRHVWYTVELPVSLVAVGWARTPDTGKSVPVLRVPVELAVGKDAV